MDYSHLPAHTVRDTQALLKQVRRQWRALAGGNAAAQELNNQATHQTGDAGEHRSDVHPHDHHAALRPHRADLWVFGYASLIWRPEFEFSEHRRATVHGWHRALQMRSRVNRGSAEQPGLVYALVSGGSCHGMVYRVPHDRAEAELDRLWLREMPTGVYDPRWLRCRTTIGEVLALAFTLSRRSPSFTGRLPDAQMLEILRHAKGRYGSTLDYLVRTTDTLRQHRIRDRESERLVVLARQQGLL